MKWNLVPAYLFFFFFDLVDASGFIGGNQTYEGALEMARQSLTLA